MDSADVLFDPDVVSKLADCGVSLLDGPTDLFPMVLAYLGRDPNAMDEENLAATEAQLKLVRPYIRYFSNQKMAIDLPSQEVCVEMSWSGNYAVAASRADEAGLDLDLRYTLPKEGSGLWVDGVYIPKDAPHKDNAYLFLNFLMRPDIAGDDIRHHGRHVVITIAHTTFAMAYVTVIIQSRLSGMDQTLEEAAMDLGGRPLRVVFDITLPLIAPAMLAGRLLAFTLSLDDLVIASFVSGPGGSTLPMLIFSKVKLEVTPDINALASRIIVLVSVGVIVAFLAARRAQRQTDKNMQAAAKQ
jgi:hypothetical protein